MNIPNFENTTFVNKSGILSDIWALILQQLITELQDNLSDEGYFVPQQTTITINNLQTQFNLSANPSQYFGDLLYDSTTDELKVNIAGTFRVVTVV
jgi:hypothetical protein